LLLLIWIDENKAIIRVLCVGNHSASFKRLWHSVSTLQTIHLQTITPFRCVADLWNVEKYHDFSLFHLYSWNNIFIFAKLNRFLRQIKKDKRTAVALHLIIYEAQERGNVAVSNLKEKSNLQAGRHVALTKDNYLVRTANATHKVVER